MEIFRIVSLLTLNLWLSLKLIYESLTFAAVKNLSIAVYTHLANGGRESLTCNSQIKCQNQNQNQSVPSSASKSNIRPAFPLCNFQPTSKVPALAMNFSLIPSKSNIQTKTETNPYDLNLSNQIPKIKLKLKQIFVTYGSKSNISATFSLNQHSNFSIYQRTKRKVHLAPILGERHKGKVKEERGRLKVK